MPTLDDNDDKTKQGQADAGGAYIGGGGGQGATTGLKDESPSSSGSYTNLQNYLGANQGNDATMGQAAYGVVNAAGTTANQDMAGLQSEADKEIAAGTQNVDPGKLNTINAGGENQSVIDTTYTGPKSYNDVQDPNNTLGAVQNAQQQADLVGKQGGVNTLLREAYGSPSYTSGENQLDTFLTQSGAGGQQGLNQITSDWGGVSNNLQNEYSGITSEIGKAKDTSAATGQTYADAQKARATDLANRNTPGTGSGNPGTYSSGIQTSDTPFNPNQQAAAGNVMAGQAAVTPHNTAGVQYNTGTNSGIENLNGPAIGFAAFGGKVPENKYTGIKNLLHGRTKK